MASILRQRLTPQTLRRVMLTAHRFTGPEALDAGIVDEIIDGDGEAVIARSLEIAQANIKHSASGVSVAFFFVSLNLRFKWIKFLISITISLDLFFLGYAHD